MYKGEEQTSKFRLKLRMMDGTCAQMGNILKIEKTAASICKWVESKDSAK